MTKEEIAALDDDKPEVVTQSVDVDDIDELLSDYKSKYKETENVNLESESKNTQPATRTENTDAPSNTSTNPNAWIGDKRYVQTGKNMGKLKKMYQHHAPPPDEMKISGSLIDAGLFLMLIDMIFPLIITVLNNKFNDTQIDVEDLQLTEKQKNDLEPIATEVIKQLSVSADPKWLLLGSLAGIYGINYMAVISNAEKKEKKKKPVKKDDE